MHFKNPLAGNPELQGRLLGKELSCAAWNWKAVAGSEEHKRAPPRVLREAFDTPGRNRLAGYEL